jgi:ceramide glucosyltransferase
MMVPSANDILAFVSGLCNTVAGLGCMYVLITAIVVLRFSRGRAPSCSQQDAVSILKPLSGPEPGLEDRLEGFCKQDYRGPVQLICGVQNRNDKAAATVKALARRCPELNVVLHVDGRESGDNRKMSNLANMFPLAAHDLIVISDSDIEVRPDYLATIVAHLKQPGVGAVTCLYHGVAAPGRWSRMAALAINAHFLPNAVTAVCAGLIKPCFGSTIAFDRATLSGIGGFRAFANCLADDYAIGRAVRSMGRKVVIPRMSVGHVCFHDTLRSMLACELRAARTIKSINPVGYLGAIIAQPFPLALIGALFGGTDGLALAAIAVCCRIVVCLAVEQAFGLERQPLWLIPLRDMISFAVYLFSYLGTTITWRDFSYRIDCDGYMVSTRDRADS